MRENIQVFFWVLFISLKIIKISSCIYISATVMTYFSLQLQKNAFEKTALKQLVLMHVNNKFIVLTAMMLLKYAGPVTYI